MYNASDSGLELKDDFDSRLPFFENQLETLVTLLSGARNLTLRYYLNDWSKKNDLPEKVSQADSEAYVFPLTCAIARVIQLKSDVAALSKSFSDIQKRLDDEKRKLKQEALNQFWNNHPEFEKP